MCYKYFLEHRNGQHKTYTSDSRGPSGERFGTNIAYWIGANCSLTLIRLQSFLCSSSHPLTSTGTANLSVMNGNQLLDVPALSIAKVVNDKWSLSLCLHRCVTLWPTNEGIFELNAVVRSLVVNDSLDPTTSLISKTIAHCIEVKMFHFTVMRYHRYHRQIKGFRHDHSHLMQTWNWTFSPWEGAGAHVQLPYR